MKQEELRRCKICGRESDLDEHQRCRACAMGRPPVEFRGGSYSKKLVFKVEGEEQDAESP